MTTETSPITMVPVSTIAPAITDKELATSKRVVISARRNKPKDGPELPADQKARFIVVPELSVPSVPSAFTSLVLDTLYTIARDQLDSLWRDNPQLSEVPQALFSVDSLLMYQAKRAEGGRLNTDSIAAWFKGSTLAGRIAKMPEAQIPATMKKYGAGFAKIAAPLINLSVKEMRDLLDLLNKEADQEATILRQMAARMRNRIAEIQQMQEESFGAELPE